ncbi:MAG: hypothetical protein NUV82_02800 [Candidatus Komeilibacteria bacterium]|nr:hypothetical protein [Candidatus Komeilibacteria bacterium]
MEYVQYCTKEYSLSEVKAWYEGESRGLKALIGVGYYDHLYISKEGLVTFFYNADEWEEVHQRLTEILTDDFFNRICAQYNLLVDKIDKVKSPKEAYKLSVALWPIQTIFNEIDETPEIASDHILNKLMKLRSATHTKHYELDGKIKNNSDPRDYIYCKGELYILM